MSMYGLGMHEYRGPHTVHDRAERAEQALNEIEAFVQLREKYWLQAGFNDVSTELRLLLVKIHDVKNS